MLETVGEYPVQELIELVQVVPPDLIDHVQVALARIVPGGYRSIQVVASLQKKSVNTYNNLVSCLLQMDRIKWVVLILDFLNMLVILFNREEVDHRIQQILTALVKIMVVSQIDYVQSSKV